MPKLCFQRFGRNVTAILSIILVWYGHMAYGFPANFPVTCTTKTADASAATVQAAINAASNGAVICVASGVATWSGPGAVTISGSKNIVLAGAAAWGGGMTSITNGGITMRNTSAPWIGSRVTGFTFPDQSTAYHVIESTIGYRFDHNSITRASGNNCFQVIGTPASPSEGLIDHNSLNNCRIVSYGEATDTGGHRRWFEPLNMGTVHANYIEDNTCTNGYTVIMNCADGNMGGRYVARFNTLNNAYFEAHSIQGDGLRANRLVEIYYNRLNMSLTGTFIRSGLFRGGVDMVFFNTPNGNWAGPSYNLDNVRSCDDTRSFPVYRHCSAAESSFPDGNQPGLDGYPCRDQPGTSTDAFRWNGANPAPAQERAPWVFFKNVAPSDGGEIPVSLNVCADPSRLATQIKADRDWYSYSPSFSGTSGVGVGPIAERPSSCTSGVGYWATDEGEWNSLNSGADGQLYRCTVTNTWSLYYIPYSYPHPLQTGAGVNTYAAPAPPTRIIIR